jgi:predicted ATP-grasp superfamily ATP-dependent carboligase
MTEVTTLLLTQQQASLPSRVSLPFASADAIANASDKSEVLRIAQANGVPTPATIVVANAAEAAAAAAKLTWPAVIKPARSRVRTATGFVSTGVSYAHDADDLRRQTAALDPAVYPLLLQERIEGPGVGLFACYDRGRPVARFAHRRIREKPPSGGVSVLRESAPLDPHAVEHADRLLRALAWHGVAMVEFKRDRRDNSLRLMEINGRFWGSLQLAIDAGVDFPAILVELARGEHPELQPSFKVGVKSRWLWGDVDSLLLQLFRSRASLNLPADHPGRLRALWDFMHFWGRDLHYEVFRRDDYRPWLLETKSWFRNRP